MPLSSATPSAERQKIAVVGSGVAALSSAWLLSKRHDVTLYEKGDRLGGHSNTVMASVPSGDIAVDTGFICFNDATYPNLIALFEHLRIPTRATDMSFAVSLDDGQFEYAAPGLFAQRRNALRPRFWSMLSEILRFYRDAPKDLAAMSDSSLTLGDYLKREGFSEAFRDDHLLPMAAAIWSSPAHTLMDYPAESFIRFCGNHGLLKLVGRPLWRTVEGGSRVYVEHLARAIQDIRLDHGVTSVRRSDQGVFVHDSQGGVERYDQVVIGSHADQALAMLAEPTAREKALLGAFRYSRNLTVLHTDAGLMPHRRRAWASWNYIGADDGLCVTYWMNRLQGLPGDDLFVTLNPPRPPRADTILRSELYEHPIFDPAAIQAQKQLWSLQGQGGVWFCGAHFGAGFHEDGLQSGLAVAEQLGGVRRPWSVANESGRIHLTTPMGAQLERAA
ncbi:NAD(P)/FAD-dependent oxidoreductase [Brevundimonas vesicularis]|uniref:FAD-dependent oxidoreductase n=1 Tax=Brevundimonas vesicularis TaxID=41276 RepID=A0A1Z3UDF5_BREVE|nr:FAD-dependent oxidoreductase [Brevundimonas vesicularis]ASE41281.1 FAD-dependent oxidoreductase [Brevundimonas vesicularis]MDX2335130.1 FAD-dependent oxidoreductase [Brevundimonas vesicularis]